MSARTEQFEKLVSREPENELFRFSLAGALVADGREREAEPHYQYCINKKADWMMPRILLGKLLVASGRPIEGRELLKSALDLAIAQHHETPESELRALLDPMG